MPLLTLRDAHLAFGPHVLLDKEALTIQPGQRIGVLGRNGAGKSTLLKVILGEIHLDGGERWQRPESRIATLPQALPDADAQTVYQVVASGMAEVGDLLLRYQELTDNYDVNHTDELERVQHQIEAKDGWSLHQRIEQILTQLELPAETLMEHLSGGWRRRVALGKALVCDPDILLLDEPTNHLDIPTIQWLEKQILAFNGTVLLITHDRAFLQNTVNHIIEVDRGHLRQWDGDYQGFIDFREQELAAEETANALFDKKLAEEEVWIRQGIKARRTRNEGRVRALKDMRDERASRKERTGQAKLSLEEADRSGKIVAEGKDLQLSFADKCIIKKHSVKIIRGDRIGLIGPNGSGKSTYLRVLLGELAADSGTVNLGTKLEVAYFDQLRNNLDLDKTVIDNISEGRDFISINGKDRHIISYLQDFLFAPARCRQPVSALSGGEQNRLILAKLFSKPANILVLDEPTNDLDLETLELLEELLLNFEGTLLLVSHDRAFLDNIVTSCLVFRGEGIIEEHLGGYQEEFLRPASSQRKNNTAKSSASAPDKKTVKKLSYKEQRELEQIPKDIDAIESEQEALTEQINSPSFYDQEADAVSNTLNQLTTLQEKLEGLYARWEALENDE